MNKKGGRLPSLFILLPQFRKQLALRPYGSDALFVNLGKGSPKLGEQLSLVSFNRVRWKICKDAKTDVITYQELRRRLATIIARSAGVDVAAQALNHSPTHRGQGYTVVLLQS